MRIGFFLAGLLLIGLLGLFFQSSSSDANFAMDDKASPGLQPDTDLILKSPSFENEPLLSQAEEPDTSTIYKWDEEIFDWIAIGELERLNHASNKKSPDWDLSAPIKLDWEVLMNILYQLKYYPELDLSIFAPVFGRKLEPIDGKTVVIEGYVLPVDEEEGLWALSAFPVASCFFCGQASPASVISVYFNEAGRRRRHKVGDKLSLSGTLVLNHDDPVELYYVLKEVEVREIL